jgi:hypothetical protein
MREKGITEKTEKIRGSPVIESHAKEPNQIHEGLPDIAL